MMDNSEEAILLTKNNVITYVNDTFLSIFMNSIDISDAIDLEELVVEDQPITRL